MAFRPGIRGKMIALIALPTLVVYVGVLGLTLARLRAENHAAVEREMAALAANYAARFDGAFREAAAIALTTARAIETAPDLTEDQIYAQLRANVLQNDVVYGAAMAFEPGTHEKGDALFCPYVARDGAGLRSMNITREVYNWHDDPRWQWWRLPRESGRPCWTDPYFDEGAGNVPMVTFSAPFMRDGVFRGVTTIDVQLTELRDRIGRSIVGGTDFIILTRDGRFVYALSQDRALSDQTVFEVATAAGRPDIAAACRDIVSGGSGVVAIAGWDGEPPRGFERWAEPRWIFYAPIRSTGWAFAAMLPERVALADVRSRMTQASVALALTLVLIIGCILVAANLFTRPIARLAKAVRQFATGDLDHRVEMPRRDELGDLARDVNAMAEDLKRHTEEIARARSRSREAMIFALAKLAESRDDDTGKHLERICRYVEVLAARMAREDPSLDADWTHTIVVTAALHDIGKVGIPDAVLKKPGRLTDEERRVMQSHTTIGGDTLIAVKQQWTEDSFMRLAAEIALGHHEKWDGSGYPFGLKEEDIGLGARIVAVADVYDALTSKRVYKDAMPHEEARRIIVEGRGRHFDPRVVDAFLAVEDGFRTIAQSLR